MRRYTNGIPFALFALIAVVLMMIWGPRFQGVEHLRETLLSYGPWAVVVSAGLMILQAVIAPLPANVITMTNGLVFGPFWGGLLSWATIVIGATLCFGLSRKLGKPFALRFVGRSLEGLEKFVDRYGLRA